MNAHMLIVRADWDAEAKVWIVYSEDVPGLATGADTLEDLVDKLRMVVPELLEENGLLSSADESEDVPFFLVAQRIERTRRMA